MYISPQLKKGKNSHMKCPHPDYKQRRLTCNGNGLQIILLYFPGPFPGVMWAQQTLPGVDRLQQEKLKTEYDCYLIKCQASCVRDL